MLEKSKNLLGRFKNKYLIWLTCLALVVCGLICCRVPEQPRVVEEPKTVEALTDRARAPGVVEEICELIYQGKFDSADKLIQRHSIGGQSVYGGVDELAEIVAEYQSISEQRNKERQAAYEEQSAELEKFRVAAEKDVNDVNDISKTLSVIAKISKFANDWQRQELLEDEFVKQTFQKAIAKASEFESKGKWLDAYIDCYSWLEVIDEDNEAYSEYAEQLWDKANIVASFQDSPCQSCQERHEGIKKEIFVQAIGALHYNYVSVVDYRQMAIDAIERCRLLAEVMTYDVEDVNHVEDTQYAAWSAVMTAIADEVKESSGFSKDKFINVFEQVLSLNVSLASSEADNESAKRPGGLVPTSVLIAHFSEAALSALDPYTVIVWPKNVPDFEKAMSNEFTGVGVEISKSKGLLTVVTLLLDTPAFYSGIDAGDIIEEVDGVPTKDMTITCAVSSITGPAGTEVLLKIRRPSEDKSVEDKIFDVTITRAKIIIPTVLGWQRTKSGKWLYMVDEEDKIGHVRISNFSERTAGDLEKALLELESEGLGGLILDLRSNPGGLLSSAIEVTDKFIDEGMIVSTRPRSWISATYTAATLENTHPDYPLVILVNRFSASASEIVAGSLADKSHKRAVLVGERTHGKGRVQGILLYPDEGAQLKYTMAYYHLPSGQRVENQDAMKKSGRDDWGVAPNIELTLRTDERRKKYDIQKANEILVKADHDSVGSPVERHTIEETLANDPQLAVALLVVKTKLIQAQNVQKTEAPPSPRLRQASRGQSVRTP